MSEHLEKMAEAWMEDRSEYRELCTLGNCQRLGYARRISGARAIIQHAYTLLLEGEWGRDRAATVARLGEMGRWLAENDEPPH